MKEVILRSKVNNELYIQLLGGKFALLVNDEDRTDRGLITDNDGFAIELYKLLRRAFEMGAFNVKEFDSAEEKTEILV